MVYFMTFKPAQPAYQPTWWCTPGSAAALALVWKTGLNLPKLIDINLGADTVGVRYATVFQFFYCRSCLAR
jgi:hypothetical protein